MQIQSEQIGLTQQCIETRYITRSYVRISVWKSKNVIILSKEERL